MKSATRYLAAAVFVLLAVTLFQANTFADVTVAVPQVKLPEDELPHPKEPVEWWYFSGHLEDAQGREYGVMASFFVTRMGNMPAVHFMINSLSEKTDHVFHSDSIIQKEMIDMMEMVLQNPPPGLFDMIDPEALSPENVTEHHRIMENKPVVKKDELAIKYEDNYFRKIRGEDRDFLNWAYRTKIVGPDYGFDLTMFPTRGPMYVGGIGNVGMSDDAAMYYYSFTQMESTGVVTINGEEREVSGTIWYDHQFGTMGTPDDPIGWDWFCIQLEDGTDLNISALRHLRNGKRFNHIATVQRADGRVSVLHDLIIEELGEWTSPETGITYPQGWKLALPSMGAFFTVTPSFNEQEMHAFGPFQAIWEGACTVQAVVEGQPLEGNGYTELVGYAYTPVE